MFLRGEMGVRVETGRTPGRDRKTGTYRLQEGTADDRTEKETETDMEGRDPEKGDLDKSEKDIERSESKGTWAQ